MFLVFADEMDIPIKGC